MELKLNIKNLQRLYDEKITPTEFVYLWSNLDDEVIVKATPLSIVNLKVRGFLTEGPMPGSTMLSDRGLELLKEFFPELETKESVRTEFETVFNLYPLSDKYGAYPRTRTLRSNAKIALIEYIKVREKYPAETILNGLRNEIAFREDATNNGTSNSFKFMKALNNWLSSEEFTTYINLEKEDFKKLYGKDIE